MTVQGSGIGSWTGTFTVTANTGTTTRSAKISIAGVQVTVIQNQPTTALADPALSAPTGLRDAKPVVFASNGASPLRGYIRDLLPIAGGKSEALATIGHVRVPNGMEGAVSVAQSPRAIVADISDSWRARATMLRARMRRAPHSAGAAV